MQVSSALAEIDALGRVRKKEERGKKYSEATSFLKIYLLHKSAAQSFITALPCPALPWVAAEQPLRGWTAGAAFWVPFLWENRDLRVADAVNCEV